jgi:predicted nucleic acid-binding protein
VYVKGEAKSTAGTTGSTRLKKVILASLITDEIVKKDDTIGDNAAEIFGSLEHAGRPALLALLALLQGRPIGNEDLEA